MIRGSATLLFALFCFLLSPVIKANEARVLSQQEQDILANGGVISEIWRDKSRGDNALEAYAAVDIQASPEKIWAVMNDCGASVIIVKDMVSCKILESGPNGDWDIREQKFRAPFPLGKFRTVFHTTFTPPYKMVIERRAGDMKTQDAVWTIKALNNTYSRVTYRASVALKIPVPRFMMRRALRKDTPALMTDLRLFIEDMPEGALDISALKPQIQE